MKGEYAIPDRIAYIPLNPYPERDLILDGATKGVLEDLRLAVLLSH